MFKKIAHNSTLPALAGNNDLKLLQDVISSEKLVLQTLQKLSTDFTRASEALRHWGLCEGEDLGDTLSACTTLFGHWSTSIASFSNHVGYIRECLKAVRTREEALDEASKRRRALFAKADSAEKKLQKMNPDNKNLRAQTDLLMGLREQIRGMDVELMNEEAALADWKRTKSREWMGVLFGALSETCEKGVVVANYGRSIVSNIPTESTEPGLPRAPYHGHSQVEPLVVEAERELHRIAFNADIRVNPAPRNNGGPHEENRPYSGMPPCYPSSEQSSESVGLPPKGPSYNDMSEFGSYTPDSRNYHTLGPEHNQPPRPDFEISQESGFTPRGGQYSTMPNSRPAELAGAFNPAPERVAFSNEQAKPPPEDTDSPRLRDRHFSYRLSRAMESDVPRLHPLALGAGLSLDDWAPHLDAAVQEAPLSPALERTSSPPNQSQPVSLPSPSRTSEMPEANLVTNRISKRWSSAIGSGWSMDSGAPQRSSSSLPVSLEVEEPSHTMSSSRSSDTGPARASTPGERRPSHRDYSPFPEEPISKQSLDSAGLGPDTMKPHPRRLSQRLPSTLTSAVGGGWAMENGAPRLDGPVGYREPPPSYVSHASPHDAASPAVSGQQLADRNFDPYRTRRDAASSQGHSDESPYLAHLDGSAGRRSQGDGRTHFGGREDERSLNVQVAREISQEVAPPLPPTQTFAGSRSASPRPLVEQNLTRTPSSRLSPTLLRHPISRTNTPPPPTNPPMTTLNKTLSAAAFRRPSVRLAGSSGPHRVVPRDSYALNADFDYISPYLDSNPSGSPPSNTGYYGSGKLATNLDAGRPSYR